MRPALLSGLIGRSQAQFPAAGLLGSLFVDEIAPQADGTAVASWVDPRSGLVASQSTPSARPIYRTNRLGAMPALQFTGGQYLNAGTPPALMAAMGAGTASIMVIYAGIQPASNAALFCATTGQTNSWLLQADGTRVGRYNGGNLAAQPPHSGAGFTSMLYTVADVSAWAPEPRLERVFINGGCAAANFGMGVTPNDAVGLGGRADDGALGLVGDVFGYLFWDRPLTQAQALQAHAAACARFKQPVPWAGGRFYVNHGNSETMGTGVSVPEDTYPFQMAQQLGLSYGQWGNLGVGGIAIPKMDELAQAEIDAISAVTGVPTVLSVFEYYNSRGAHPGPANQMTAYLQARRAAGSLVVLGSSMDSYLAPEADRADYNAFLDANHSSLADAYAPLHQDSRIGVSGACGAAQPSTYFVDQIGHCTPEGYAVAAGLMATAVGTLP